MRHFQFSLGILSACLLVCGCSSLPSFDRPLEPSVPSQNLKGADGGKIPTVPTLSEVLAHIQCEIWNLPRPAFRTINGQSEVVSGTAGDFSRLWEYQYVVYGVLTLDVTDDGAVDPALSLIAPSSNSRSRQLDIGLQYGDAAHREITQTFVLDLDAHGNPSFAPSGPGANTLTIDEFCKAHDGKDGKGILGTLGIQQVIAQGIQFVQQSAYVFPMADKSDDLGDVDIGTTSLVPSFGSTIDFTLTYGINGDPKWTLTHVVGPGGGSNPLLSYTRTRKDTLVLSFAAGSQRGIASAKSRVEAQTAAKRRMHDAAESARSNATFAILQRLLPSTH